MVFEDLEWDPEYVPGIKLGLHIFQILFGFVVFCLEIAVFRAKDSKIVGNNGWTFAVCFLSVPAWIYLIGTPRFERTRKLAEPHAMLAVDAAFAIFWLSAFASQAAYNTANLCGEACSLSKAIVGLGVFVTIFFAVTTFLSIYSLKYYQFHGSLPGYDKQRIRGGGDGNIDPDKAAFSMAPHDEEAYAPVHMDDHDQHDDHAHGAYGGGGNGSNGGGAGGRPQNPYEDDPNRYGSLPSRRNDDLFDADTEYRRHPSGGSSTAYGGGGSAVGSTSHYAPPTAQDDYDDERPAAFPNANYDRAR